jgi:putative ABC transport system substrate-binding protein
VLNRTEALWGIADSMVLNAQTGKQILLTSFRSQIPFIGPSEPWAKAGALYALDRDYFDLGQQAGEIALRILKGEKPQKIPLEPPRRILYYVNRKTAEHMRIEIPENVLKAASAVY